mmetsp:Transcript_87729/g.220813  ORF Transcript_87729/g.220813 Transcript_87729/m.220813 type:complete len:87 (-) Transcript_87729:92-352(-)
MSTVARGSKDNELAAVAKRRRSLQKDKQLERPRPEHPRLPGTSSKARRKAGTTRWQRARPSEGKVFHGTLFFDMWTWPGSSVQRCV